MTQCNSATMSMTKSRICSSRNCFWNSISFHSSSIRLVNFTLFCVLIPIIITTLSKMCGLWSLSLALCLIHGLLLFENCKKMYLFTHQKCHEMWWFGSGAAGAFHLSMYLCMRWQSNSCSWNDFNRNWGKKYENSHANTLTYVHTDTIAAQTRWLKNVVCGVRACIHQFIFYTFFFSFVRLLALFLLARFRFIDSKRGPYAFTHVWENVMSAHSTIRHHIQVNVVRRLLIL